jgi:hypothetical protein
MKGITISTTLAAIALLTTGLSAQSVSYSIEYFRADSFFVKEVSTGAATAKEPKPTTQTTYRLFRSVQEFDAAVEEIRKQAKAEQDKAMESLNKSKAIEEIAEKIKAVRPKQ